MKLNPLLLSLGIASGLFSACTPYPPNPQPAAGGDPQPIKDDTATSEELLAIDEKREEITEEVESGPAGVGGLTSGDGSSSGSGAEKSDYPKGIPIPGKDGFVFNPYTNQPVDVRGIPSGMLVRDPNDDDPDHKFRVP